MVSNESKQDLSPWHAVIQRFNASKLNAWRNKIVANKIRIAVALLVCTAAYAWQKPSEFAHWWLTKDQQGQILFMLEKYDKASQTYANTRWKAYSAYGAEDYKQAALLYGQFSTKEDLLHRANAAAHGQEYVKARSLYQNILAQYPDYQAASHNLAIVVQIIDDINLMSESQKPEQGDSPKELGDDPQRGDGAEKKEARKQEIEQLSAEQLLLDPALSEMWLRQVQKNPARFLGIKFQMQQDAKLTQTPTESEGKSDD